MNFLTLSTIVKSAYIQKHKFWKIKINVKKIQLSLKLLTLLKLIILKSIPTFDSKKKYLILPIYFNSSKLLSDFLFFSSKRYYFFINKKSLQRLTYLSPCSLFFLETSKGLTHHNNIGNSNFVGRLVAFCV